jgi:hypothetical protein
MGGPADRPRDTRVNREIDALISRRLRVQMVGLGLFKRFRDASVNLLCTVHLLGRHGFVRLLRETERPDSPVSGLTNAELEQAWEVFDRQIRVLAAAGRLAYKRPKDWRG